MSLLNVVTPEQAEGKVAETYAIWPKEVGIPTPLLTLSASPELVSAIGNIIRHYFTHPHLGFELLAHIRYFAARHFNYDYCINFNGGMLQAAGVEADVLQSLPDRPEQALLEEKDLALFLLVTKALKTPDVITKADVDAVRAEGWTDADIMDAIYHGANMASISIISHALTNKAE